MRPNLKREGINIVVRGQFNPAIIQPSWLALHDLIREEEAEKAEIKIIHPNASAFDVKWMRVKVTQDRLEIGTDQESFYEPVRDLVLGIFKLLDQTPVAMLGVNLNTHFQLESEEEWHAVGDTLAPKADWDELLNEPGMRSLTMEGVRPDDYSGWIRVKVEPSRRVSTGVYIQVNNHYNLGLSEDADEVAAGNSNLFSILAADWLTTMERSHHICETIASIGSHHG